MNILVINAGSSSLKYQLFDMDTREVMAKGVCERIGIGGHLRHSAHGKVVFDADIELANHSIAANAVIEKLTDPDIGVIADMSGIDAVGHRVVSGGQKFSASVVVDAEVLAAIEECIPLAPLHIPANLMGIRACAEVMPTTPQVAVFDTAFHQSMPPESYLYPIPRKYYEQYAVRKYGYHGTSHRYIAARCAEMFGREDINIINCHLGNGSSICAIVNGKCYDTSMGLTPLDGLVMGTRSGTIDPAVVGFLSEKTGMSAGQVIDVLNKESGLLALSGVSSDYRDITAAADEGNENAKIALEMLFKSIRHYIGAYAAEMGKVDALVFTAGIGENNAFLREKVTDTLGFMGVVIDKAKNEERGDREMTAEGATVRTFVIATDEEMMIAMDTAMLTHGN
jgi:acetate kinase